MPSPFPGMNPYLEQSYVWEDFHNRFVLRVQEMLVPQFNGHYFVRNEPRFFLHELSGKERSFFNKEEVGIDEERIAVLKIHGLRDNHVVTVVELLSPSNKTLGQDYEPYNAKRRTLLLSGTHFVEIDLRRGGQRPESPQLPPCDYYALVSRCGENPRPEDFWPLSLHDRLPVIPIPLTYPDPDVHLDLQEVLHRTYDGAGYGKYICREMPEPLLRAEDAAWAQQFLPPRN